MNRAFASLLIATVALLPHRVSAVSPAPEATFGISVVASGPDTEINAGPGFSDVSPHQIVRTSGNVEYIATPTCTSYPNCPDNYVTMMKANGTGVPTSFAEQDASHHPASSSSSDMIGSTAIAIDGNGIIWVAYNTKLEGTHVVSFDTSTNTWGTDHRIGSALAADSATYVSQGREGVALAVNSSGTPVIVFSFSGGSTTVKYLGISTYSSGAWSAPVRIDNATLGTNQGALHPAIAYSPSNVLLVAWLVGDENVSTYNNNDGLIYVRTITNTTTGAGSSATEIPDTGDEHGNAGFAATVIDNGPSLLITSDGVAHITYINSYQDDARYFYSNANDYATWNGNEQLPTQSTHDPSLGPDGSGGLYIYGHGTPYESDGTTFDRDGHGKNLYRFHKAAGATTWGAWTLVVSDPEIDCSVSTRWSQFFDYFPSTVDELYWYDKSPNQSRVSEG